MRVSVDKNDPGYRPNINRTERFAAYLGRKRIERVVMADEERGEIVRFAAYDDGAIIIIDRGTDEARAARETLRGKVRIVRHPIPVRGATYSIPELYRGEILVDDYFKVTGYSGSRRQSVYLERHGSRTKKRISMSDFLARAIPSGNAP